MAANQPSRAARWCKRTETRSEPLPQSSGRGCYLCFVETLRLPTVNAPLPFLSRFSNHNTRIISPMPLSRHLIYFAKYKVLMSAVTASESYLGIVPLTGPRASRIQPPKRPAKPSPTPCLATSASTTTALPAKTNPMQAQTISVGCRAMHWV